MNNTLDMTKGRPLTLMLRFALPIMLTSILQQLYSLADGMIVGRFLGMDAFAAIGAAGFIAWLPQNMFLGLSHGLGVVLGQLFGAGDREGFRRANLRCALLCGGMAIVASALLIIFRDSLLALMKTPAEMLEYDRDYLLVIYMGLIFFAMFNWAASALRALGDSRTPMLAAFAASGVNIALDYVLIKFIPMGVTGAALATVIAQALSLVICLAALKAKNPEFPARAAKPVDGSFGRLLRLGIPPMLRDGVIAVGGLYVQAVVNTFGVAFVAGVTAASRYFSIVSMAGGSLEGAMATFAAQNTGAGNPERMKKGARSATVLTMIFAAVSVTVTFFAAPVLIRLITGIYDGEAFRTGVFVLHCTACFLPFLHLLYLYRAAIQGMGDSLFPMLSGFAELAMRVFSVLALTSFIGSTAACIADGLGWLGAAALVIGRYAFMMKRLK